MSSLHGVEEKSFKGFIANATGEEINPVVCNTPVIQETIRNGTFVLTDVSRGARKPTHYKYVYLIRNIWGWSSVNSPKGLAG